VLHRFNTGIAGAIAALTVGACASNATSSGPRPERGMTRHAVSITGEQLHQRGSDLLGMLSSRVSNMRVAHGGAGCPQISMRGRTTVAGVTEPGIYVDGQRAADTCILNMLSPTDLALVEVYPMGVTSRQGYHMDGAGLILIFTRRAGQ
jgi:hypothetical protein